MHVVFDLSIKFLVRCFLSGYGMSSTFQALFSFSVMPPGHERLLWSMEEVADLGVQDALLQQELTSISKDAVYPTSDILYNFIFPFTPRGAFYILDGWVGKIQNFFLENWISNDLVCWPAEVVDAGLACSLAALQASRQTPNLVLTHRCTSLIPWLWLVRAP